MATVFHLNLAMVVCPRLCAYAFSGYVVEYAEDDRIPLIDCFQREISDQIKGVIVAHPAYQEFYKLHYCSYITDRSTCIMADYLRAYDRRWDSYSSVIVIYEANQDTLSMLDCIEYNWSARRMSAFSCEDELTVLEDELLTFLTKVRACKEVVVHGLHEHQPESTDFLRTHCTGFGEDLKKFKEKLNSEPLADPTHYLVEHLALFAPR